jgi:gluconolactonase
MTSALRRDPGWDLKKKVVMRHEVQPDGGIVNGRGFFGVTAAPGEDALDGMKVDRRGNLYVSGRGGVWIISPGAKHPGMTARTSRCRVRLGIPGVRP